MAGKRRPAAKHERKHQGTANLRPKPFSSEYQPPPENRSGGPNPITNALKRALAGLDPQTRRPILDLYAEAIVTQAAKGNGQALKEVNARVDGPLPERVAGDPPVDLSGWSLDDKRAMLGLLKRNRRD